MPPFAGFVGPSYQLPSVQADIQKAQNLYAEALDPHSKAASALVGCPGTKRFALLPTAPVRGLWAGHNRLFAAAGSKLYEVHIGTVTTNGTAVVRVSGTEFAAWMAGLQIVINRVAYTISGAPADADNLTLTTSAGVQASAVPFSIAKDRGEIGDDAAHSPVRMWANGGQLGLISADHFLVDTGLAIEQPTYSASGEEVLGRMGTYIDGYAIIMIPDTNYFQISSPVSFSIWDELDRALKSGAPDRLLAVLADREQLWLFGYETSELWRNTGQGLGGFAFERDPVGTIQQGICAPWSAVNLNDGPAWIGEDVRGRGVAWKAQGYQPVRISTHAVEQVWNSYPIMSDAEAYVYQEAGHQFWVIHFPTGNATWVYDSTTNLWHERSFGPSGRQNQRCHAFAFQKHLCGDKTTGDIWEQSLDFFDDNGSPITFLRVAPHLSNEFLEVAYHRLRLELERGQGDNALMAMRYSDDGGHTWTALDYRTTGALGAYKQDVMWQRLGSARDRVFEISSTAAIRHVWTNAYLELTPGKS
jgi:hypothetical protein